MLVDIGQSGVAYVDDPAVNDSFPGYLNWATTESENPQPPRIYVHTNDGILHVVDPLNGNEERAILPPPVLMPSRLATIKSRLMSSGKSSGKLAWIDVQDPESTSSDDIVAKRSNPVYLLDGSLQKKRVSNAAGTAWTTYLLAGLGRGGSGMYVLDVDKHDEPKLQWYRERFSGEVAKMSATQSAPTYTVPLATELDRYFLKLGFNSPKPAFGITGSVNPVALSNIVVLAGGSQNNINLAENGNEGAVLLVLDAKTGDVLKGFDIKNLNRDSGISGNNSDSSGPTPRMGMMVSEPSLYRSDIGGNYGSNIAGRIFAADNRGNIFTSALEKLQDGAVTPITPADWKLNTVATLQSASAADKNADSNYAIPYGILPALSNGRLWLAGGTSDLRVKISSAFPKGVIENKEQLIFAFRINSDLGSVGSEPVYNRSNLQVLSADAALSVFDPNHADTTKRGGWMIKLKPQSGNSSAEYVSAKPILSGGILYIATFIERKIITNSATICQYSARTVGDARLYAIDVNTGGAYWSEHKYTELNGAKITGLTLSSQGSRHRIVITYDKLQNDPLGFSHAVGEQHFEEMNSFVIDAAAGGGIPPLDPGQNIMDYWIKK
jgi:hypothetical protein